MHSSGMRTARLLTVSQYAVPEGVYLPEGVPARGVPALGVYLVRGCTCRGVLARGGICLGGGTCPGVPAWGMYLPGGRGVPAWGVYLPGGTCPGVYLPGGLPAWRCTCPSTPPCLQTDRCKNIRRDQTAEVSQVSLKSSNV